MRIFLVGTPRDRERLLSTLPAGSVEIAGEFASIGAARLSSLAADAILMAVPGARPAAAIEADDAAPRRVEPLTPRELEVLEHVVEGRSNKAIAARLGISDQTVKFHVAAIYGKLGVANRTAAVRRAMRDGVITF